MRQNRGHHLEYMDATSGGNSGSPLYLIKDEGSQKEAYVVGVHVGCIGSKSEDKGNCAVILSRHMNMAMVLPD